ncbi:PREDICTED: calpain-B-like [Priapulus caudatus]|uniref:Calpain-B-like n=1 Tax=Priapulus caudatus TaxID=37621 RepID=A0ABM1ENE3_PRICU|nr:PREDICTED: calpain-B-like [Priapulus caudatus]
MQRTTLDTFWMNPQFRVSMEDADEDDDEEEKCTCIVALMQKGGRNKRKEGMDLRTIGYAVYKLKEEQADRHEPLAKQFFAYTASVARSASFINMREVSSRFKLPPGQYVIVPSTFEPDEPAEFVLRVFSEKSNSTEEFDVDTGFDPNVTPPTPQEEDQDQMGVLSEVFSEVAGEDLELNYTELQQVLNTVLQKEFEFDGFSNECCRSMVAMKDVDRSGELSLSEFRQLWRDVRWWKVEFEFDGLSATSAAGVLVAMKDVDRSGELSLSEFRQLWRDVRWWKNVFKEYDTDQSGCLTTYELRAAMHAAGYNLSSDVLKTLVLRYGKDSKISFEDFILCAVKLKNMIDKFQDIPGAENMDTNEVSEWMCNALY